MLCAATLIATGPAHAGGALPTNGQYVAGQGSITSSSSNVTVNQTSSHGIINWQNFSIGQGNSVLVYADGVVTGPANSTGALIGYSASGAHISGAYIDANVTGTLAAVGTNHGASQVVTMGGATGPDPTQQSTYTTFTFGTIWTIAPGELPTLLHAP